MKILTIKTPRLDLGVVLLSLLTLQILTKLNAGVVKLSLYHVVYLSISDNASIGRKMRMRETL